MQLERGVVWGIGPGALLGPEGIGLPREGLLVSLVAWLFLVCWRVGSGRGFVGLVHAVRLPGGGCAAGGGWDRPYFENCTVDASIFVFKLVRAHGGCLGTRSR